ncbi:MULTISPECIES: LysR family transcriptional regulator [Rhodomicrobium]|uniref:LysR family transcriptional regulator n=1 Tax=Rhodomicrobium TaxID=1068 RepID=UPI000B4C0CBC|nr:MULTISPECIES: LysR family transcriptional regulator [Rhodomicrobium]
MHEISLRQLRIVSAIAKTGKVIGAAEILGVTPPAVTLQLRQLEAGLGLALFERAREGMRLTAAGQHILQSAARIDAELASCLEGFKAMRGLKGGTVAIGVVSTAKYFAPAALGAFKRKQPDVELKLFVGNRGDTIRALADLELDLAIMGRPPEHLDLRSALIGEHPHVIIARPDHALAKRRGLSLGDLADETFLMREQGSGTRMLMERIFADAGRTPRMGMEISSNETIKQAVMAGLGIAFISGHTIAAEVEIERLAVLNVEGLPATRQWWVVHHADKRLMPAPLALWAFLHEEGGQYLPVLPMAAEG